MTGQWPSVHATPYPRECTVHHLFEEWADRTPDAPALVAGGVRMTYRELDERANRLAHRLRKLGVRTETRVGLCVRDERWVVGALAVLKAGGAYVPLDPTYPAARIAHMCAEAGVALVLGPQRTDVDVAGWLDFPDDVDEPATRPDATVSPLSLAYVMFTSGSTGTPKAVAVGHRNIVRLVRSADSIPVRPGDVSLQAATVSFDAATLELWGALLNGASVLAGVDPDDLLVPDRLRTVLVRDRVDVMFVTTALLRQLTTEDPTIFRTVRQLSFGGEQADARTVARLAEHCPDTDLRNLYGPTEITVYATSYSCPGTDDVVPIGVARANSAAYVLDERLAPVEGDSVGELYVGGDGVSRGYLGRPGATATRFLPDPFAGEPGARMYRTGDLVRRRADGALVFLGRVDRQVKVRGHRVEPGEVEAALRADDGVVDVAVLADTDSFGDARLLAYVVLHDGVSPPEVRARLGERLPAYLVPAVFVPVDRIPLKANGKVDTDALSAPTEEPAAPTGLTEVEQRVLLIWQEVLGTTVPATSVSFFELGGNSLAAARVRTRLAALSGVDVPVRLVFDHPTIATQAAAIAQCAEPPALAVVAPRTTADGSLADLLAEFES